MSQKRRRLSSDSKEAHYETYSITCIATTSKSLVSTCADNYQIYDISSGLEVSPPPYHPAVFLFDTWDPPDVILHVGKFSHRAHKTHLKHCCRYFEGMFGHDMSESSKSEVTLHGVNEDTFRTILSGFYTGFISLCTECVISIWKTATFLHSSVILNICEHYILSHMNLDNVFEFFEVSCELGFERIKSQALTLICSNLGPSVNLFESEEFLALVPTRMSLVLSGHKTNCTETELATAIFKWATFQYDTLLSCRTSAPARSDELQASGERSGDDGGCPQRSHDDHVTTTSPDSSLNDSGINISDECIVELHDSPDSVEIIYPPPLPPPQPHTIPVQPPADFTEHGANKRSGRTYKRKYGKSRRRSEKRESKESKETSESGRSRKRRRDDISDVEGDNEYPKYKDAPDRTLHDEIGQVLLQIEYRNMEIQTLQEFLHLSIVKQYPALYNHISNTTSSIQYKCLPERGAKTVISLCYHRCYRSSDNPSRTVVLYYYRNNRWHVLNNTFSINMLTVKSIILHDYLYVFGMHKLPGQPANPRGFRFNQFTGHWREIAAPIHSFNANSRCLVYKENILLIGTSQHLMSSSQHQHQHVRITQYNPQTDAWHELATKMPINYYQLQRYVSSIISHNGLLYYVSKNKLYSLNLAEEDPECVEVALISAMFTDISNYWLFAYHTKIILLGGLCNVQGGGSWENREILIYDLVTKVWTVMQNSKPSPMYEMMGGMVYQDKIYTVGHGTGGGESIAKMELFDLGKMKWRKGINLKYESPMYCTEYGLNIGCMMVKCYSEEYDTDSTASGGANSV